MHERAKSISNAISYALSNLLQFNVTFLSRELWQEEDEGSTQIAYIEDDKGERYKITLAVTKTTRVEQTKALPDEEGQHTDSRGPHFVRVSTSDDYDDKHVRSNT